MIKSITKRLLCYVLTMCMVFSLIPLSGLAASAAGQTHTARVVSVSDPSDSSLRKSELMKIETEGFSPDAKLSYSFEIPESAVAKTDGYYGGIEILDFDPDNSANRKVCGTITFYQRAYGCDGGDTKYVVSGTNTSESPYFAFPENATEEMKNKVGISDASTYVVPSSVVITVTDKNPDSATYNDTATVTVSGLSDSNISKDFRKDNKVMMFVDDRIEAAAAFNTVLKFTEASNVSYSFDNGCVYATAQNATASLVAASAGTTKCTANVTKGSSAVYHKSKTGSGTITVYSVNRPIYDFDDTSVTISNLTEGVTYTIDGVSKTAGPDDEVLNFTGLPATATHIDVISKDGASLTEKVRRRYKIEIDTFENGYVTTDKSLALPGEKVTVFPHGDETRHIKEIFYNDGKQHALSKNAAGDYYFVMPESNVTINGSFETDQAVIRGYLQHDTEELRLSELLEVYTVGFAENATLQYTYTLSNTVKNCVNQIHIYTTSNMYKASETELRKGTNSTSVDSSAITGGKYLAGSVRYGSSQTTSNYDTCTVTVVIKDTNKSSGTYNKTMTATYTGFKDASLEEDLKSCSIVMFKGDKNSMQNLLGLCSIVHIDCSNSSTKNVKSTDSSIVSVNGSDLTAVSVGKTSISATVSKTSGCDHHSSQTSDANISVYVVDKAIVVDSMTVKFENVPVGLVITLDGVSKTSTEGNTTLVFNDLTPNTKYTYDIHSVENYSKISADVTTPNHIHDWSYGVKADDPATIVAACANEGCSPTNTEITLVAPQDLDYDGTPKKATILGDSLAGQEALPLVEYYKGTEKISGAPVDPGNYTAKITVENATASVDFTIASADNDINYEDVTGGTVSGKESAKADEEITVTAEPAKGYALDKIVVKDSKGGDVEVTGNKFVMPNDSVTVSAVFEEDEIGSEGTTDGVPDKYQRTITFKVVNGSWDEEGNKTAPLKTVITLIKDGKWNADGTGSVKSPEKGFPAEDYTNGSWDNGIDFNEIITVTKDSPAEYTLTYVKDSRNINYYTEKTADGYKETDTPVKIECGKTLTVELTGGSYDETPTGWTAKDPQPENNDTYSKVITENTDVFAPFIPTRDDYTFDGWSSSTDEDGNVTLTAKWLEDKAGSGDESDGVPDKFQRTVIFKVVNGTWDGTDKADKKTVATLLKEGKWSEEGTATVTVPSGMTADYGYENGAWNETLGASVTVDGSFEDVTTYTHTFTKIADKKINYNEPKPGEEPGAPDEIPTVPYGTKIQVNPNGGSWKNGGETYTTTQTLTIEADTTIADPERENYFFMGWDVITEGLSDGIAYQLKAEWEEDEIGSEGTTDGVPDKYQRTITFKVVNGTWDEEGNKTAPLKTVITLIKDGKWSADGTGSVKSPEKGFPADGYTDASWNNGIDFNEIITVTKDSPAEYTLTYVKDSRNINYYTEKTADGYKETDTPVKIEYGKTLTVELTGGSYDETPTGWTAKDPQPENNDTYSKVITENTDVFAPFIPTRDDYTFDGWSSSTDEDGNVTLTAKWLEDKAGSGDESDGVPDKYQRTVIFKVVNGTWDGTDKADKKTVATLLKEGKWSEEGTATVSVPSGMTADYGYENGAWDETLAASVTVDGSFEDVTTYTHTFAKIADKKINYNEPKPGEEPGAPDEIPTVPYGTKIQVNPNGGSWKNGGETYTTTQTLTIEADTTIADPERENYFFMGWDVITEGLSDGIAYQLKAEWEEDEIGSEGTTDGVPDKYQRTITFKVVNGSWDEEGNKTAPLKTVITLIKDGKWNADGTGSVKSPEKGFPAEDYTNGSWDNGIDFNEIITVTKDSPAEYTLTYVKDSRNINYYTEKTADGYKETDTPVKIECGKTLTVELTGGSYDETPTGWTAKDPQPENNDTYSKVITENTDVFAPFIPTRDDYTFDGWSSSTDEDGNVTLTAKWLEDKAGSGDESDGIPDKFQRTVIFKVINGTWDGTDKADKKTVATLLKEGKWSEEGTATVTVPSGMTADYGYENGAWNETLGASVTVDGSFEDVTTYTHTFTKIADKKINYNEPKPGEEPGAPDEIPTVPYGTKIQVNPNGGSWKNGGETYTTTQTLTIEADTTIADPERENYFFMGWDVITEGLSDGIAYQLKAEWEEDEIGSEGTTDGIPDKFQRTVIFKVVNGTWDGTDKADKKTVATLLKEGKWSEEGTATVTVPSGMTADYGYENGAWDETLAASVTVDGSFEDVTTYTHTFTKIADKKINYNEPKPGEEPGAPDEIPTVPYGTKIQVNPNGGSWENGGETYTTTQTLTIEADTTIADPERENYFFMGWDVITEGLSDGIAYQLKAEWEEDEIGSEGTTDGVPDKYQRTVIFKVVNGTWDGTDKADKKTVATLLKEGKWSEEGTATVTVPSGMTADYGYENGAWDETLAASVTVDGSFEDVTTYTHTFTKIADKKINYNEPKPGEEPGAPDEIPTVPYGTKIQVNPNSGSWKNGGETYTTTQTLSIEADTTIADPERENYFFMGWDVITEGLSDGIAYQLKAEWEEDEIGSEGTTDGVPEKFQRTVIFKVVNGTWDGTDKADKKTVATLLKEGKWSEEGTATVTVPSGMTADYGYENGAWDETLAASVTVDGSFEDVTTYTHTFTKIADKKINYNEPKPGEEPGAPDEIPTVPYGTKIQVNPNGGSWKNGGETYTTTQTLSIEADTTIADPERENYFFMGWDLIANDLPDGIEYQLKAEWEKDEIGPDGKSDGIPDKYQKKVIFAVVFGTWADGSSDEICTVVTLLDAEGKPAVDGTAAIAAPEGMLPFNSYDNGSWDKAVPETVSGKETEKFTYSFVYVQPEVERRGCCPIIPIIVITTPIVIGAAAISATAATVIGVPLAILAATHIVKEVKDIKAEKDAANGEEPEIPDTGSAENAAVVPAFMIAVMGAALSVVIGIKKRKKNEEE